MAIRRRDPSQQLVGGGVRVELVGRDPVDRGARAVSQVTIHQPITHPIAED